MVHEEGDAGHGRSQAMLDALCWALRNPKHALPTAPPLAQPPAEAMGLLVGRAVEVLWPVERAWYSGLVQAYDAAEGKHFLVYSDGDVEWLALHSGYYAWHLLPEDKEQRLRVQLKVRVRGRVRVRVRVRVSLFLTLSLTQP